MADLFDYTDAQPGPAADAGFTPEANVTPLEDYPLTQAETVPEFTPDPFDPLGNMKAAAVGQTPYEELLKRTKKRNPQALDVDFDGRATEALGKEKGMPWDKDTVLGVDLYGEHVTNEQLAQLEGGKELLAIAAQKRGGRRGFFQALATGSGADFLPYVGDLASLGVSIKNMKTVRDTYRKMEAGEPVSLQEKVLAKVYEEESLRQAQSTWLGTAGSIIRTAPAFAVEFMTSGGVFSAAKKGAVKTGLVAARNASEDFAVKSVKEGLERSVYSTLRTTARGALSAENVGTAKIIDGIIQQNPTAALYRPVMEKTAATLLDLHKNPKRLKAFTDGVIEYAKRGMFDHGDEVMRDLPPGIMGKLREAAGVAFIEAPIKGAMYAALDYGVANPVAAAVMGADEPVTKTEVSLTMAGAAGHDKELMDNAKMLSFGSAVAEYASESSGRAFNALFGIVTDYAGAAGRGLARRGIRAADPSVAEELMSPREHGSFAKRLMDSFFGTEDQMKEGLAGAKRSAVESVLAAARSSEAGMREGAEKLLGKELLEEAAAGTLTADMILSGNRQLTEKIVTDKMKFMDRSLIGYWVANKMLEKNLTPQKFVKWTQTLGYDGIMGEFMEERYNGFAQGFFGLDGTPDKGFWDRIVKGAQQGFAPGFEQAAAEIFAFALPTVGRAAVSKTFATIGAGPIGNAKNLTDMILAYTSNGSAFNLEGQDGLVTRKAAASTDAGTMGVLQNFRGGVGSVDLDASSQLHLANVDQMVEAAAGSIPDMARAIEKGETGWTGFLARSATAIAAVVTGGNPIAGGFFGSNPIKATILDSFGSREGAMLANSLVDAYKSAVANAQADTAAESAAAAEPGAEGKAPAEASFETAKKRADAEFRDKARLIITNFMKDHGALMADNKRADEWVKTQFARNAKDGKYAGMTEPEFRKAFSKELIGLAADGSLRFDVVHGRAVPILLRKPSSNLSEAALQAEAFMNRIGAVSALDLDEVQGSVSERLKLFAGQPVDADLLMKAAFDEGPEGNRAVHQVVMSGMVNTDGGYENALRSARDYARALVTANKSFFRAQYADAGGTTREVRREGQMFAIYDTALGTRVESPEFKTAEEAEAFLAATPGFEKRKSAIWLTPTNTLMTRSAASLLSKERATAEYMADNAEKGPNANPFETMAFEDAMAVWKSDMAMAEKYRDARHEIPEAEMGVHQAAFERTLGEQGYETVARRHAELRGIRMTRNPAKRGENVYVISAAAMNFGGQMFIPFKYAGSVTASVEDAIEVASKGRTITVPVRRTPQTPNGYVQYGVFRDPADPTRWRPAAREFIIKINTALGNRATELERSTEESDMRFVREARFLQGMFDHNNYNSEAESHAIAAYLYYRGHAALGIGGSASGGSAFYATLGKVADEVMGNKAAFYSFMSLANRLDSRHVTGEIGEGNNHYVTTLGGFAPKAILDLPGVTTGINAQPSTPMQEAMAAGVQVADGIERALKGLPASGLGPAVNDEVSEAAQALRRAIADEMLRLISQANLKGGEVRMGVMDDVRGYFAEDLPWLAIQAATNVAERQEIAGAEAEIAKWNAAGFTASAAESREEAPAVQVSDAAENEAVDEYYGEFPADEGNSLAEDAVRTSPAFAVEYARRLAMGNRLLMGGGDPQKITADDVFDIWKKVDPFLREEGRENFKELLKKRRLVDEAKKEERAIPLAELFENGLPSWFSGEETTDDPETSGNAFNPDAMARALEKDVHAILFSGLSQRWMPQFRGDASLVRQTLVAASREAGPESVSSLLDSEAWINDGGIHRAFESQESFDKFLETANADAKNLWQPELKAFFQAIGYKAAFRVAMRLKGAWRRDVVAMRKQADGRISADYNKASMSAQADRRLRAGAYASLKAGRDPSEARRVLSELSVGDVIINGIKELPAAARIPTLAKRLHVRMSRLADAVDALVGPGTDFAGVLRDPRTSWWKAREAVRASVVDKNDKELSDLSVDFGTYKFGGRDRGGILAKRVEAMVEVYETQMRLIAEDEARAKKQGVPPTLKTDEKFLRNSAGIISAMLMRGSTVEAEAFAKTGQLSKAGDRGVVTSFLNWYYEHDTSQISPRRGEDRRGGHSAAKARAVNPEAARAQKAANLSTARIAALKRAGIDTEAADKFAADYAKSLLDSYEWPGGLSLFATVGSVKRSDGSEVSQPTHAEINRVFRESFNDASDEVARAAITTGDKTEGSFAVQWPKALLRELTGVDKPTFDEFYAAAAALVSVDKVSPKRTALFLAQGWGVEVRNPRLGLDLGEELVGDTMVAGVFAKAMQMDGVHENGKAHFSVVMEDGSVMFIKAKQQIQPMSGRAVLKDVSKAMDETAKEFKLHEFLDMDSLKESDLLGKDADGRTAVALFATGNLEAVVKLPGGGTSTVADLAKKYKLELQQRKVGDVTKPLVVITVPGVMQMQYAANLTKSSRPGDIDLYTDFVRALVSPTALATHAQLAGAYLSRAGVKAGMEAKALESLAASDPWIAELIETGVTAEDADIRELYALKLASALREEMNTVKALGNKYAESSNGRTVIKDANGDPTFVDGDRWLSVSDAYGAEGLVQSGDTGHDPIALVHNAIAYTPDEAKRKGRTYMPSAVQINNTAPGFRYALRADAKIGPSELRERLAYCHAAMLESLAKQDPQIYLAAYTDAENGLEGVFLNPDGTPVPEGSLFNIGDLFDAQGNIDLSAFYDGKDLKTDAKGEAYILLRGELLAGSRTPLDNPSSYRLLSAAEPVSRVKADGSGRYKYRRVSKMADGTLSVEMVPYPENTLVPGPDSHIRMNEGDALISGGDHDGDMGGLVQFRSDKYGRLQTAMPGAAEEVAKLTDDADAKKVYQAAAEVAANAMLQEAVGKMAMRSTAKDLARTGGKRGHALFNTDPIRSVTKPTETRAKTGVTESRLLKGGRSERGALVKPNLTNADSAAKFTTAASDNANMGRSTAVSAAAALLIAHDHGISIQAFAKPQSFLTAPETLSEEGAAVFAKMFGADPAKNDSWDDARWTEYMNFAARTKNITFDDLKEGIMTAAEIYPAVIDLYMYLGYNSGARTRAEFDDFHLLWVEWMRGPEGRSWLKAYANTLDPEGNGGAGYRADLTARINAMRKTDRSEFTVVDGLSPSARDALAAISMSRGLVNQESIDKLRPLADLFRGMSAMAAVKRAYDWKKMKAAFKSDYDTAVKASETLGNVLGGSSRALKLTGDGQELASAARAASQWVEVMSGIHDKAGSMAEIAVRELARRTPRLEIRGDQVAVPEEKIPADDAVKMAVNNHFAWKAAVGMTPDATQAKIAKIVAGDTAENQPMRFIPMVETVYGRMFRSWARQLRTDKGQSNGVFEHLLPPSADNKLNRVALMGSIDASDARAVVGDGLNALRDWAEGQDWVRPVNVKFMANGAEAEVQVTPADMYWMLLQYATLTGGKSLDAGRATQSLVPLFGARVFADLGAAQARELAKEISSEGALEAVTVSVFGKGPGRSGVLTASGGYDTARFATAEIQRRARLMKPVEEAPKNLAPAVAPIEAPAKPNFEKIAPVAEVKVEARPSPSAEVNTVEEVSKAVLAEATSVPVARWTPSFARSVLKKVPSMTVKDRLSLNGIIFEAEGGGDSLASGDPQVNRLLMDIKRQTLSKEEPVKPNFEKIAPVAEVKVEARPSPSAEVNTVEEVSKAVLAEATSVPVARWTPSFARSVLKKVPSMTVKDRLSLNGIIFEAEGGGDSLASGDPQVNRLLMDIKRQTLSKEEPVKPNFEKIAPVAPEVKPSGFLGYKGGFTGSGKGTEEGDGKDKAMRQAADSAIVELDGRDRGSSSRTSFEVLGAPDENSQVVMLARNGSLSGRPLRDLTKNQIRDLHENLGVQFVVGDMPGVDSAFIDFLREIGAPFTVFHSGDTPRIRLEPALVVRDASGKAVQTEASSAVLHLNSMLDFAKSADRALFRIPARINGQKPVSLPVLEAAASASALAFERIAGLPWMANLKMAQAVAREAASATREIGYNDPAIPLAFVLAAGRDAYLNNDKDAVDQVLGMMARAGRYDFARKAMPEAVVDVSRIKAMKDKGAAVREMTPRAVLSEYILAADPRRISGVTSADVERAIWGEVSYSLAEETVGGFTQEQTNTKRSNASKFWIISSDAELSAVHGGPFHDNDNNTFFVPTKRGSKLYDVYRASDGERLATRVRPMTQEAIAEQIKRMKARVAGVGGTKEYAPGRSASFLRLQRPLSRDTAEKQISNWLLSLGDYWLKAAPGFERSIDETGLKRLVSEIPDWVFSSVRINRQERREYVPMGKGAYEVVTGVGGAMTRAPVAPDWSIPKRGVVREIGKVLGIERLDKALDLTEKGTDWTKQSVKSIKAALSKRLYANEEFQRISNASVDKQIKDLRDSLGEDVDMTALRGVSPFAVLWTEAEAKVEKDVLKALEKQTGLPVSEAMKALSFHRLWLNPSLNPETSLTPETIPFHELLHGAFNVGRSRPEASEALSLANKLLASPEFDEVRKVASENGVDLDAEELAVRTYTMDRAFSVLDKKPEDALDVAIMEAVVSIRNPKVPLGKKLLADSVQGQPVEASPAGAKGWFNQMMARLQAFFDMVVSWMASTRAPIERLVLSQEKGLTVEQLAEEKKIDGLSEVATGLYTAMRTLLSDKAEVNGLFDSAQTDTTPSPQSPFGPERFNEETFSVLEEETLAVMRKYQPRAPGLALRHAEARLAYQAAVKAGIVDPSHPAYVEYKKTSAEMLADLDSAKAMAQRDGRSNNALQRLNGSEAAAPAFTRTTEGYSLAEETMGSLLGEGRRSYTMTPNLRYLHEAAVRVKGMDGVPESAVKYWFKLLRKEILSQEYHSDALPFLDEAEAAFAIGDISGATYFSERALQAVHQEAFLNVMGPFSMTKVAEASYSLAENFEQGVHALVQAADDAQEEVIRGSLSNDDRVKAYAGKMRSPHNAYWYEGTAPRHAELLVRLDAGAAIVSAGAHVDAALAEVSAQVTPLVGNKETIKRINQRIGMLRKILVQDNGGSLPDPRSVRGDAYGKLMESLGLLQSGIAADTKQLMDEAKALGTPDGDAIAEAADDAYFGVASALRVARSVISRRQFGEAGVAGEEKLSQKDGTPLEDVTPTLAEVSLADPDTGMPDASDDFNMALHDTDYWLATTYLPSFQGVPLRDILMDKEPLAVVHRFVAISNAMEAMFGTDSDTGSLRYAKKVKGGGHKLENGGYVYDRERTGVEYTRYSRRKTAKELADVIGGGAFTAQEYALTRWFTQAVYVWAGDGGDKGRQILGNTVDLYDLNWGDNLKDTLPENVRKFIDHKSLADAMRKLSEERINLVNGKRPYALDKLVQALDNNLPEALRDRAISELVTALDAAAKAKSGAQGAMKSLSDNGWAAPRTRAKPDVNGNPTTVMELYDCRFSVPVKVTEEAFLASGAHAKLLKHGRDAADLTLSGNGQRIRDEVMLARKSFRSLSWFTDGDGRMFGGGPQAPVTRGSGFFQYHARKRLAEVTPEYRAKVNEAYGSLKEALDACLDRRTMRAEEQRQFRAGVPVAEIKAPNAWLKVGEATGNSKFSRMFALFRDLAGGFEGTERPEVVAQMITSDRRFAHHGEGFGTDKLEMRELAKAIYSLTVRKLHDSAWDAGLSKALTAEEAGFEAFNAAMEDSAAEHSADAGRAGSTFSEVYNLTGALPANLTAGEALAKFATETATAMRYRGAVNQALLSTDEHGMPLVYMEPADGADDTVPDVVWQAAARMWVRAAGRSGDSKVTYDESRTGKENAQRLYPVMVDGKVGQGATRQAAGGLDRYILTDVKVPPGISAVKRCAAMKDPRGDDTYAVANVFAGGEAAGNMEQLFAISGFSRTDLMLPQIGRVLSWSKSLSVMNSFFFPIATAFESPVAAVGIWPTIFGLSSRGSNFFRKAAEGNGALDKVLKAGGVDLDAPGMKDILKMIGSDDPALVDMKMHATLAGLSLADRTRNVTDHDRMALAKDVKSITAMVRKQYGDKAASSMKGLMEGMLEHSSEFAFEYVINATKIAVFAQMNNRLRNKAIAAGRWWDPVRSMRRWASYINAEVGGIDTATVAAMTPRMQNWLKALMFSWEWTLGAWLAGGGGVFTQKFFGMTTSPQDRGFMFGRWARMYGTVMLGIPVTMQMLAMAMAKAGGDDDDDDKWFNWQNEKGRQLHDFDITPLLRHIGNSSPFYIPGLPTWGKIKEALPATVLAGNIPVGALIPGLTGDEGNMVSSRKRRYYMHLGKQGWEVAGWFENPMSSLLGKMSMPAQRALEGILGVTPSTGWEKPFAELGFWERWLSLDGEKSALLNMAGSFTPFSYASMARAPEAGAISMFGPIGKGMSKTRAEKEMAKMFDRWADADSYAAVMKGEKNAWTDLKSMSVEWLDALRQNGYDPAVSLKAALAKARKPLYDQVHAALPRVDGQAADIGALERAARGLNRLDYIHADLMKSIKAKDKLQNIKRTDDVKQISNDAIRESFMDPYGRGRKDARKTQSADLGGDVSQFLATDELPATVLGYKVTPIAEIAPADLKFFRDNPTAAGFFKKGNQ